MKNKRRNETIAAKVLSRFDSGSGNQEVEIHMATIEEFIKMHAVRMSTVESKYRRMDKRIRRKGVEIR